MQRLRTTAYHRQTTMKQTTGHNHNVERLSLAIKVKPLTITN